ncbi:MAG: hypothetical protein LBT99_01040 [Bifidobacteriaceae bacterium]|jgi:hypothetical protein|nr:hypothetical protein [Bifidobacteriaceae bacterium]
MTIKKFGILISIFLLVVLGFINGSLAQVNAASSSTVLPVAKGGTGANTLSSGQALIGNGANNLQTKPIDTSPQSNSNNLITSGAVKSVSNNADLAKGNDNIYFVNTANNDQKQTVYLIGPIASLSDASPEYANFFGKIELLRQGGKWSIPINLGYNVWITSGYSSAYTYAQITPYGKAGQQDRTLNPVSFKYNNVKYVGVQLSIGMGVNFIMKGYIETSLNCISNQGLCTGREFLPSEITELTNL